MEETTRGEALSLLGNTYKVLYRMAAKRRSHQSIWEVHTLIIDIFPDSWFGNLSTSPLSDYGFQPIRNFIENYAFISGDASGRDIAEWLSIPGIYTLNNIYSNIGQTTQIYRFQFPDWVRNPNNATSQSYYSYPNILPQLPWPHTLYQFLGVNSSFDIQDTRPIAGGAFRYQHFGVALWEQIFGVKNRQLSQSFSTDPRIYVRVIHGGGFLRNIKLSRKEVLVEVGGFKLCRTQAHIHIDDATGDVTNLEIDRPGTYLLSLNRHVELPLTISVYNNQGILDLYEKSPFPQSIIFAHPHVSGNFDEIEAEDNHIIDSDDEEILPTLDADDIQAIQDLIESLKDIPPGKEHASNYHEVVHKLLPYIFGSWLTVFKKEKQINGGRGRIDIYANNAARTGWFFAEWRRDFQASYIPMECKNYSNDVSNTELNQLNDRMGVKSSHLGFLFCRKIKDKKSLMTRVKDKWHQFNNCLLVFDDRNLRRLVRLRLASDFHGIEAFLLEKINDVRIEGIEDEQD